jgi:hypothetical protein
LIAGDSGEPIAMLYGSSVTPEAHANAALVVEAPELLAAAIALCDELSRSSGRFGSRDPGLRLILNSADRLRQSIQRATAAREGIP